MKAQVVSYIPLPQVPSASGIEIIGEKIFIIGDNSPFLFLLDKNFRITKRIRLFNAQTNAEGKIKKSAKPDLESLTTITINKRKLLLTLGSGSIRDTRDVGFLIDLENYAVERIMVTAFYDHVRKVLKEWNAGELNIEGTVFRKGWLYLFQRGNISGKNVLISILWKEFISYSEKGGASSFSANLIRLPKLSGISSGFSGACLIPASNDVLFTASVEDTPNAIDDGPSLGSFVGLLDHTKFPDKKPPAARITFGNKTFTGKVESIAMVKKISENEMEVLAVCDQDDDNSELLHLRIVL